MVLPEPSLLQSAPRALSRTLGLGMNRREWVVAVGEAHLVPVLGQHLFDRGFCRMAIGTLVVRELNDHDLRLGISPHTDGIVTHFYSRG